MFDETLKGGSGNDTLKGGLSDADTPAPEVELLDAVPETTPPTTATTRPLSLSI